MSEPQYTAGPGVVLAAVHRKLHVGAPVHYTSYGTPGGEFPSVCRAAIITEVDEPLGSATVGSGGNPIEPDPGTVGLAILNPTGIFFNQGVPQDEHDHAGGTWHWPEWAE